uniref:Uncharacterized protein n=1 Tax=Fagus sylvatica TaxID=28930 RepID=A0A2N9F2N3_FAGSY
MSNDQISDQIRITHILAVECLLVVAKNILNGAPLVNNDLAENQIRCERETGSRWVTACDRRWVTACDLQIDDGAISRSDVRERLAQDGSRLAIGGGSLLAISRSAMVRSPNRVRERDRLEVGGLCEERPAWGGWGWQGE